MADRKKEALMRNIQRSAFAAHECVLYLDGHPENKKALEYHRRAVEALNGYTAEYERLYGRHFCPGTCGQPFFSGAKRCIKHHS